MQKLTLEPTKKAKDHILDLSSTENIPYDIIYKIKFIIGLLTNHLWYHLLKDKGLPNVPPLKNCSLKESLRLTKKNCGRVKLLINECKHFSCYRFGFYMGNSRKYGAYDELLESFSNIKEIQNLVLLEETLDVIHAKFFENWVLDVDMKNNRNYISRYVVCENIPRDTLIECTTKFFNICCDLGINCVELLVGIRFDIDTLFKISKNTCLPVDLFNK